ncbi:hypothetical protein AGLY_015335 [Aphis glycines]|uniref:Uncharacterized protein n=1 Tax=Aphis glycines TaxID=307491 RepID=A0A6G0T0Y2_APHGL|nr:hypothetical protein AGLY_015335 [Aphis glycines]
MLPAHTIVEIVIICILLLHALFVPTSKKTTHDDKGRKSLIKYSIRDSQQSFIIFAKSSPEVEEIIDWKKDLGIPIQPFIIVIGHQKYNQKDILRPLDVVFKIFHVFNLSYPLESYMVWLFIQKLFYYIHGKLDQPQPLISLVLAELCIPSLKRKLNLVDESRKTQKKLGKSGIFYAKTVYVKIEFFILLISAESSNLYEICQNCENVQLYDRNQFLLGVFTLNEDLLSRNSLTVKISENFKCLRLVILKNDF